MNTTKFAALILAASVAVPALAKHDDPPPPPPSWTDETSLVAVDTMTHVGTLTLNSHVFSFTDMKPGAPVLDVGFYNDNPPNNNIGTINTFIKSSNLFGLSPSTSLTNLTVGDGFTGGTITSATPFNYMAVHIGGGEILFHWSTKITSFAIAGESLSNYRTFFTPAPVPEPETYAMMIAGLGLVGFMARRRKQG